MHKQAAPWRHEELRWESRQALTDQAGFAPTASALFTRNGLVDGDRSEVRDVDAMYERIETSECPPKRVAASSRT